MTQTKTATEACGQCHGAHYLLTTSGGLLHAEPCGCFSCGQCSGDGRVYTQDENGASYVRDCDCAAFRKKLHRLGKAGIPGKFATADFGTYVTSPPRHPSLKRASARARDFIADFGQTGRGLVFMGPPGIGKTHLAVAVLKSLILEKGIEAKFVDFFQLLSDIRHGYSQDLSDQALIAPYLRSPLLVIDELAKGRNTEWELTVLDQIIAGRYNAADRVTLFTTNYVCERAIREDEKQHVDTQSQDFSDLYTRHTLQEKIGPRIYSRIAEMCDFLMMEGTDYRQKRLPKSQQFPRPPLRRGGRK